MPGHCLSRSGSKFCGETWKSQSQLRKKRGSFSPPGFCFKSWRVIGQTPTKPFLGDRRSADLLEGLDMFGLPPKCLASSMDHPTVLSVFQSQSQDSLLYYTLRIPAPSILRQSVRLSSKWKRPGRSLFERRSTAKGHPGLLALLLRAKTLLGAPGIATRSKDATRGSWHRY